MAGKGIFILLAAQVQMVVDADLKRLDRETWGQPWVFMSQLERKVL